MTGARALWLAGAAMCAVPLLSGCVAAAIPVLAAEALHFLALGDLGADAGPGVEPRNAGAARAHPLGERALGAELDFELAGEILPLELLVLADVGRDHLLHLSRPQQLADALIVDPGLVRREGEVLDPAGDDRVE